MGDFCITNSQNVREIVIGTEGASGGNARMEVAQWHYIDGRNCTMGISSTWLFVLVVIRKNAVPKIPK